MKRYNVARSDLAFLFSLALLALAGCSDTDTENSIRASMEAAGTSEFKLKKATDFEWDRVVVVGPYLHGDAIDKLLGFTWYSPQKESMRLRDDSAMLLFVRDDEVVRAAKIQRGWGDWAHLSGSSFSPSEATFRIWPKWGTFDEVRAVR